jgi:hypothetical protein
MGCTNPSEVFVKTKHLNDQGSACMFAMTGNTLFVCHPPPWAQTSSHIAQLCCSTASALQCQAANPCSVTADNFTNEERKLSYDEASAQVANGHDHLHGRIRFALMSCFAGRNVNFDHVRII